MAPAAHRSTPSTRLGRLHVAALALALAPAAGAPACRALVRPVVSQDVPLEPAECPYCARLDATWSLVVTGNAPRAGAVLADLRWRASPGSPHQLLAHDLFVLAHAVTSLEEGRLDVAELSLASMGSPALAPLRRRLLASLRSRAAHDLVAGLVQGQCAPSRLEVCRPFAWPPLDLGSWPGPDSLPATRSSP